MGLAADLSAQLSDGIADSIFRCNLYELPLPPTLQRTQIKQMHPGDNYLQIYQLLGHQNRAGIGACSESFCARWTLVDESEKEPVPVFSVCPTQGPGKPKRIVLSEE